MVMASATSGSGTSSPSRRCRTTCPGCRPYFERIRLAAASGVMSEAVRFTADRTQVGMERDGGPVGEGFEDSALYDRLRDD